MVTCKPCRPEVRQIAPAPLLKDLDAEREKAPYAMVVRFLHLALALPSPPSCATRIRPWFVWTQHERVPCSYYRISSFLAFLTDWSAVRRACIAPRCWCCVLVLCWCCVLLYMCCRLTSTRCLPTTASTARSRRTKASRAMRTPRGASSTATSPARCGACTGSSPRGSTTATPRSTRRSETFRSVIRTGSCGRTALT